jgi:hypothetical protein
LCMPGHRATTSSAFASASRAASDETSDATIDFMQRQVKANQTFFVWMNTTRMHLFTHVRPSMHGQSGMPDNEYADGMIEARWRRR